MKAPPTVPRRDRRYCRTCRRLVLYFTGPSSNVTAHTRKHSHEHTKHLSYYYCNTCCPDAVAA